MGKWCEVFRAGTHTDSAGRKKEWTTQDLDRMVSNYDPKSHEAPICIDHNEKTGPVKGGPAYGWVEGLKRVGQKLYASFRQVVPEFSEMVNQGLFKKRSISIYPDGTLRHVAWLGAKPPAIKGLEDFKFSDSEADQELILSYSEAADISNFMEDLNMPTVEELQAQLANEKAAREVAESENQNLRTENQQLSANFSEASKKSRRAEIDAFIEKGIVDGKVLPAWKEDGLGEFMMALDESETEYQFSENSGKKTPLKFFQDFISSFSEHGLFKDMTKGKKDNQKPSDSSDFSEDDKAIVQAAVEAAGGKVEFN